MSKKILVVDDEKLIVKGICFSLEQEGMEVDCAYDGEEALEYAKKCEYDLVLLDVMLPKLDGFQVCQQIREFSDMPVVMLTAKSEDMDKILGLEYGADDYHEAVQYSGGEGKDQGDHAENRQKKRRTGSESDACQRQYEDRLRGTQSLYRGERDQSDSERI